MYLKAALTVEASGVIAISMIVIGMCLMLAFNIYHESMDYVQAHTVEEIDAVETFRQIRVGKLVVNDLFGE